MKSPQQTLQQLVSPEIFVEIQTSFVKKHGAALAIFENTLQPLLDFPADVPALADLSDEQQNLFESFFDLSSVDAELMQKQSTQSFADNTICRCIFPILFNDNFMGLAVLLRFSKTIDSERDDHLLHTLSFVKHKSISLKTLQDETHVLDDDIKALVHELQNILHLFLEAGVARAQVSPVEARTVAESPPKIMERTAILFCAPDGQIVDSDSKAAEFLGYENPGDLSDLNFLIDLLATDYDREKIRMLFHEEPAATTSVALIGKDESSIQVDVQVNVQRTSAGIVGFECLLSATPKEGQSENGESNTQPSTLNYEKKRIAELQSSYRLLQHQLSQTVTPLAHKLEKFFKVDVKDESIKHELSDIHRLTKSLSHLNQQLACFTLPTLPQRQAIDINQLLNKIAAQLKKLTPPSISIATKLQNNLPTISANSELLVHAIGNLCKNSIEAMQTGGTLVLETCANKSDKNRVSILVRDSGSGISASIRSNLFEPFHTTKKNINAGLGLPAIYGIVKSHDGDISIKNENSGVTVTLTFPGLELATTPVDKSTDKVDVKGYILIIDDEQDIAEVTAMALRRSNYGVFTCTTCEEALDIIAQVGHKLNLFIIDNQLIGIKGMTCAKDLISKAPNIPILFYSGAEDDLELMEFIKRIGAGWLKKPFSAKELLACVESLMQ